MNQRMEDIKFYFTLKSKKYVSHKLVNKYKPYL